MTDKLNTKNSLEAQGQKVDVVPSALSKSELDKLRREVEQGKLPQDPSKYNHAEEELKKTDTFKTILEAVFKSIGKVPAGSVERIELSLQMKSWTLDDFREKRGVNYWKVENGKLKLLAKTGNDKTDIFVMDILPWTALKQNIEVQEEFSHKYKLGDYTGAKKLADGQNISSVEGSVDKTQFANSVKTPQFYKDKSNAASLMIELYEVDKTAPNNEKRFDPITQDLIKSRIGILEDLGSQTDHSPAAMAKFHQKYTPAMLYGDAGIYNFVLSFQRVMDIFSDPDKSLMQGSITIGLRIGQNVHNQDQRYVKAVVLKGSANGDDDPGNIYGKDEVPGPAEPESEEGEGLPAEHLAGKTRNMGTLIPTADQFNEHIDEDVASTELLQSYKKGGTNALLKGFDKIPPNQREAVLGAIFQKLGEKDPDKAYALIQEIIAHEKGAQETAVSQGLDEKINNATGDEKKFWQAQKLMFEISQTNDLNEKGEPRFKPGEAQEKQREMIKLLTEIEESQLPAEVKEMYTQQKQYLDLSMRQGLAGDMIDTANNTLESMMMNRKDEDTVYEDSFEELKLKGRSYIAEELNGGAFSLDQDSEVYLATSHVLEAIRLCITYQYPQDVAELKPGETIPNPISHYYEKIKAGTLTEIKLPDGVTAQMRDCLLGEPKPVTGTINLEELFVVRDKEFELFDQYQSGEEKLGEDGMWNWVQEKKENAMRTVGIDPHSEWFKWGSAAGGAAGSIGGTIGIALGSTIAAPVIGALASIHGGTQIFSDVRESFLESKGGFIKGSSDMFPPVGELSKFFNEGIPGSTDVTQLGSVERLQIAKIQQLIGMKHWDEARALCIEILQDKLTKKKEVTETDINSHVTSEIEPDYGEKIRAQVRLQLKEQGIDDNNIASQNILNGNREHYPNISSLVQDRTQAALQEMARIRLQDPIANSLSDAEVGQMSQFEKLAYSELQYVNGHTISTVYMTAERTQTIKLVAQTVVEIIIIEAATMGAGSYIAGANAAARGGMLASRSMAATMRGVEYGGQALTRTSKVTAAMGRMGYAGRAGAPARWLLARTPRISNAIDGMAQGATWYHRGASNVLHGASFVQMQSMMHGKPIEPITNTGEFLTNTAMMAGTLYGLGKIQQFTRGATVGAQMSEAGTLTGVRSWPGLRHLNQFSAFLGRHANSAQRSANAMKASAGIGNKVKGYGLAGGLHGSEIGVEILAMHELGEAQRWIMLDADEYAASHDPDAFNRWAHTAGVVLGLRTWRGVKRLTERGSIGYLGGENTEGLLSERAGMAQSRFSETIKNDPRAKLEFSREYDLYFKKMKQQSPEKYAETEAIASKIKLQADTKAIIEVPCYIMEADLAKTLEYHAKQTSKEFEVVVCLNAGPKVSEADYRTNLEARKREIDAVKVQYPNLKVHVFDKHFAEPVKLIHVRKLLEDSICISASRANLKDPIIIRNDADNLSISEKYVESFIKKFEGKPTLDYALGQIEWDASFKNPDAIAKKCPEILIGQRFAQVMDAIYRWKKSSDGPRSMGSAGGNTAFRAGAYMAAGGYDVKSPTFEDLDLGRAMKLMRYGGKTKDLFNPDYHAFSTGAKLQTSPRRALDAIINGKTLAEQWSNFDAKMGSSLKDAEAVKEYQGNNKFIQKSDIEAAQKGDQQAIQKIKERAEFILESTMRAYWMKDAVRMKETLKRMGIVLEVPIEQLSLKYDGNGEWVGYENLKIDMNKSFSALQYLYRYNEIGLAAPAGGPPITPTGTVPPPPAMVAAPAGVSSAPSTSPAKPGFLRRVAASAKAGVKRGWDRGMGKSPDKAVEMEAYKMRIREALAGREIKKGDAKKIEELKAEYRKRGGDAFWEKNA